MTRQCLLWVISRHFALQSVCPLYPRQQTFLTVVGASAKGQTRTFGAPLQERGEWNSESFHPYLEVASGSIPLFLIASEARAEARNSISRLEPSISPEPATTAAENVWTN